MQNRPNKTYRIAILGILTGIILIQNFVPFLGYIPIPPLNPTIIHITVIVAALTLGVKDGMIVGAVWGVIRLIKAFVMPSSPLDLLLFTNPMISIVPRILVGFIAGYAYFKLKNHLKTTTAMTIASVLASLTNTILVLFFIYVFYRDDYATAMKVDMSNLVKFLGTIVLTNGVAEAIAAGVIAPFIAKSLKKFSRN